MRDHPPPPVFEKGYPSYEAVNRKQTMTDEEMIIRLHDIARTTGQFGAANLNEQEMREIADRFAELSKLCKTVQRAKAEAYHKAVQG